MNEFVFDLPASVIFGPDAVNRVAQAAADYGTRALLVTEAVQREQGTVARVADLCARREVNLIVHADLPMRSTSAAVHELVTLARASRTQVVIGLGGMRVLAAARAAAVAVPSGNSLYRMLDGEAPQEPPLPFVQIPTSFRDHFTFNSRFVITEADSRRPRAITTPRAVARTVLYDPKLGMSLSTKYAASTMMDILLAAVEGYLSTRSAFLSDTLFLRAVDTIKEAVDDVLRSGDSPASRQRATEAGLLTAVGLSVSSQGAGGALTYAMNSRFGVPKSWLATALLPHVLDYHAGVRPEKVAKIARALGEDVPGISNQDDAGQASTVTRRLIGKLSLPARLQDFGLTLDDMVESAEIAAGLEMVSYAPVALSRQDLYDLLKQAL
ncbi:MAG: iron-containing alcohol dehydrogenase [Spirochaetaceae bacterium]